MFRNIIMRPYILTATSITTPTMRRCQSGKATHKTKRITTVKKPTTSPSHDEEDPDFLSYYSNFNMISKATKFETKHTDIETLEPATTDNRVNKSDWIRDKKRKVGDLQEWKEKGLREKRDKEGQVDRERNERRKNVGSSDEISTVTANSPDRKTFSNTNVSNAKRSDNNEPPNNLTNNRNKHQRNNKSIKNKRNDGDRRPRNLNDLDELVGSMKQGTKPNL